MDRKTTRTQDMPGRPAVGSPGVPPMPLASDGEPPDETGRLVLAAQNGDHAAWEELHRRYRPFLAFLTAERIPRKLRGRFDTEDVVQSAFLAAFRMLQSYTYNGEESFRAWLQRISINKLVDRIRSHDREKRDPGRERPLTDADTVPAEGEEGDSPSRILGRAERHSEILGAIARLPAAQQEVLWLRDFEHKPWAEIAAALGCTDSTARKRHGEALEALMRLIS